MGIVIGLTGGIATGKSTITNMFIQRNIKVIDADKIAHDLMEKDTPITKRIIETFGSEIAMATGHINRKKLGALVFNNEQARKQLNEIVHPEIKKEIKRQIELYRINGDSLIVLDAPLLFETHLDELVNITLVVYTSETVQLERLMNRDKIDIDYAKMKISTQMKLSEKMKRADFTIDNSLSILESSKQFNEIFDIIMLRGESNGTF